MKKLELDLELIDGKDDAEVDNIPEHLNLAMKQTKEAIKKKQTAKKSADEEEKKKYEENQKRKKEKDEAIAHIAKKIEDLGGKALTKDEIKYEKCS